ncbi:MAG: XisI protein [Saprospiraceae bacterium]
MDKVKKYQKAVVGLLDEMAKLGNPQNGLENQIITDLTHNQFQFVITGWQNGKDFVHVVGLHLDIKDGKVRIWKNNMDIRLADELIERGIPKSDIVLAFHAPQLRPLTGFAVA